jgi:hypothetical protein
VDDRVDARRLEQRYCRLDRGAVVVRVGNDADEHCRLAYVRGAK